MDKNRVKHKSVTFGTDKSRIYEEIMQNLEDLRLEDDYSIVLMVSRPKGDLDGTYGTHVITAIQQSHLAGVKASLIELIHGIQEQENKHIKE